MSDQILFFLIDTILGLFSMALLMRFYVQLLQVPYNNPISQFLIAVTDFIVRPARRVIPGWKGMDLSTIVLAWLAECIIVTSLFMLKGYDFGADIGGAIGIMALLAVIELVKMTLYIVLIMIIVQAILSWISPNSPLMPILHIFTRPLLGFFQKRVPTVANVDLSPIFALVLIQLLLMIVTGIQMEVHTKL